uniref:Uncharacterized protein n=1 Tax=Arundo donax TaxID=35708 RepID=A0A0A9CAK3_ARUDO
MQVVEYAEDLQVVTENRYKF